MVVCSKCNQVVEEGKFCEKCGSPLVPKEGVNPSEISSAANNQSSGGGFFDKISSSMNKAATDLMAIKSDFSNGTLICKVSKIPNVQEKKIKIEDTEILFYNNGTGFTKYNQTFTTQDKDFLCFYVKNVTIIQNNFIVDIKAPIKNLNDIDLINAKAMFNLELKVDEVDKFFNSLMSVKQDTWRVIDLNSMLSMSLNKIVNENTISMLKADGNIDLRDVKAQLSKFNDNISNLINDEVGKYGLKVNIFNLANVETNMQEINKVLIDNLYKNCAS